jgi:protocatechuate 3,4-dioxygenase beta subunit
MIACRKSMRMSMKVPGLLSLLFVCTICSAQTPAAAPATASVSGRVTIGGKGAAGITVVATVTDSPFDNRTVAKNTTDDEGVYHLTGLAAGRFTITPIARAFVVAASDTFKQPGQKVNVAENESVTKIDFALVRGGVITGRITDLEGHPIIGEKVNIVTKADSDNGRPNSSFPGRKNQTDDRGVYRIYGLNPGSYRVSVGQAASGGGGVVVNFMGMGASQYTKTFYPGVAEESKATLIEINEGTEATNIDITPGKSAGGFSASGRVVDAESGKPVASAYVGYSPVNEQNQRTGGMNFATQTDANGKFRVEGIQPGHYAAFIMGIGQENASYSDPTPFEVSDGDVTGIEIKVRRGATIEGVAVLENNVDPAAATLLQSVSLLAYVNDEKGSTAPSYSRGSINPDGSFRFAGLSPGKARISMMVFATPTKGLQLVRTEFEGLDQPEGIELTAGAHITGVRLVFAYGTGKIRGEVRVEGGALPEGTAFAVSLRTVAGGAGKYNHFIEVDARGHFLAEDVPPGTYELTLKSRADIPAFEPVTRTITVANGAETQVILVVNLARKAGP